MRLLLLIFTCFFIFDSFCQSANISGLVLDETTSKPIKGAKVDLLLNDKIIETKITDSSGTFIFENLRPKKYSLSCFYKMNIPSDLPKSIADDWGRYALDSEINIIPGSRIIDTFRLLVTCPYDKTKDQDYCPVCKKSDMVQPIFWGLPKYDLDGNLLGNFKNIDDYYSGGCSPDAWCNPTKHCKRCNINF